MPIQRGDSVILKQSAREMVAVAASGVTDGSLQIKMNGAFSTVSVHDVRSNEPFVLTDPTGNSSSNGKPNLVRPDGQITDEKNDAAIFHGEEEAEKFRDSHSGIPYFVPKRLRDL